jgi:hypothetical protein
MSKTLKYFNISQSTQLYIYGAGNLGISACKKLLGANYNVLGIMDQNKNIDKKIPVNLYYPGEEPHFDNTCVCICLYNGLQHISVARLLRARGYKNLLFLPLFLNTRAAKKMITIFNCFVSGYIDLLENIPLYDELWELRVGDYFLHEAGEFVTVMIPSNQVYTGKRKIEYPNPFEDYAPEVTGDTSGFHFDSPLDTAKIFELERLKERFDLFTFFNNALFDGLDFFIDAASPAQFNPKGYFNLLDGHHRTSFLYHNKFSGIPLRVLKKEYEQYFNQKAANALMQYCKILDELPSSISHPAFVRFPTNENIIDKDFFYLVSKLLSDYKGK